MNNTHNKYISASMMCADMMNIERDIHQLESAGVDYLHIDIMDAHFVPNLTFGPDFVKAAQKVTNLPIDIHLLMDNPKTIIPSLEIKKGDIVSIHSESKDNIVESSALIKQKGANFGLALNPETSVKDISKYLPYLDVIVLMLIVPGFAGSSMLHGMMDKVLATKKYLMEHSFENILIEVDGSVSAERAQIMSSMGADIFVGGTSGIFKKDMNINDSVIRFRENISK